MSKAIDLKLADALRKVGLDDMADEAATGRYSDFRSPLPMPKVALVEKLYREAATEDDLKVRADILALRQGVMAGDFDG